MAPHVIGREEGIDERLRADDAEVTDVTVDANFTSSYAVAKRCQCCGELVEAGSVATWAIVQYDRGDGERTAAYPAFCNAKCLDEWVRAMTES